VLSARAIDEAPAVLEPGEAFFVDGCVRVRTARGALALDHVRIEETEDAAAEVTAGQELRGEAIGRLVPRV